MWITACVRVCACVCQRSAVFVCSHYINWESRLVTAGLVAGVEGGVVWLCTGNHGFSLTRVLH